MDGHQLGRYVQQDNEQSIVWLRLAANQGYHKAQKRLGFEYYSGQTLGQDYEKAAYYFKLAMEQGNLDAQVDLAGIYINGFAGKKNPALGIELRKL